MFKEPRFSEFIKVFKKWGMRLLVALLLPGVSGCLTSGLWSDDFSNSDLHWGSTNEPPRLYQTKDGKDVIVCYVERRSSDSATADRAYLLFANQRQVEAGHKPGFIKPARANGLKPVPFISGEVSQADPNDESLRAVGQHEGNRFTLVSKGHELGSFGLPQYSGINNRAAQIFLTPLAVTGDVVIVGLAVGSVFGVILLVNSWPEGKVVDSHWKP